MSEVFGSVYADAYDPLYHDKDYAAVGIGRNRMNILQIIWKAWKKIGQTIGDFIARIVLSLFYFTLFVPFALGLRLFGDPLTIKSKRVASWWLGRGSHDLSLEDARRQF